MGRPPGSRNKSKTGEPKAPKGSKENPHRGPETNVSEGLLLVHLSKIGAAEKKKDEAVNALRAARKSAKQDGVDLKTLDALRVLAKLSATEIAHGFNTMVSYSRFMSVPVYGQMQLFESVEVSEETVTAAAKDRGLHDGKMGRGEETNPYDIGSPAGQAWLAGHREGQEALLRGIKPLGEG